MLKYSSTAFCLLVIDSPLQQAPDEKNVESIIKFIRDNQPNGSQMILAIETLKNIEFPGKLVNLKKEHDLLTKDNYKLCYDEIFPLLKIANKQRKKSLF